MPVSSLRSGHVVHQSGGPFCDPITVDKSPFHSVAMVL